MIEFEWDDIKRHANLKTHGLDFKDMVRFDWSEAETAEDTRRKYPETRYISYGYIDGRLTAACYCYRGDRIRMISLRKTNPREVRRYEKLKEKDSGADD